MYFKYLATSTLCDICYHMPLNEFCVLYVYASSKKEHENNLTFSFFLYFEYMLDVFCRNLQVEVH